MLEMIDKQSCVKKIPLNLLYAPNNLEDFSIPMPEISRKKTSNTFEM